MDWVIGVLLLVIIWRLAAMGDAAINRKRKNNAETKSDISPDTAVKPSPSLDEALAKNRAAARSAVTSREWKRNVSKAKNRHDTGLKPSQPSMQPAPESSDGRLSFLYTDASGNQTHRQLIKWRLDGGYIKGFCLDSEALKTFRRDRIDQFFAGEELLNRERSAHQAATYSTARTSDAIEILFTGFSENDRRKLEADAKQADMVIRKTVTRNLTFLCAGPRAGQAKLETARERGATVLNREQFESLIATGALPD